MISVQPPNATSLPRLTAIHVRLHSSPFTLSHTGRSWYKTIALVVILNLRTNSQTFLALLLYSVGVHNGRNQFASFGAAVQDASTDGL